MLEPLEELDELLMHQRVVRQLKVKLLTLTFGGKLSMKQ